MSEFLNQCCTFQSNRRKVGNAPALNAIIVSCNVCGTSYTVRKPNEYVNKKETK